MIAKLIYVHCVGNRWLTRWDKEVELFAKLLYYGITTGRGLSCHSHSERTGLD